ncbi:MAG TPA: PAS domain S-box protein, partial [Urbifossiella sp.]|nr:PAS domain S-box protein [Urbifossiella sp.]
MPLAPPALASAAAAHGLLAAAAAVAALAVLRRRGLVPRHAIAVALGAAGLAGAAHALAPPGGTAVVAVVVGLAAAILAGGAVDSRRPAPAPATVAGAPPLGAALAACRDGVAIVAIDDPAGVRIVFANPAFEHLTGYTNEEAVGLSPSVLVDEADSLDAVREAVRGTAPVRVEVPGRRKDGSRVWAEWQVVPVVDADGGHRHSVAVIRDTTDRRRGERALRESEARFRELFERAADAILVVGRGGRILDANAQACHTLGYTRDELTALDASALEPVHVGPPAGDVTLTAERTYRRKDGAELTVEVRYATIEGAGRGTSLEMFRDVTRRRRAELALREREEVLRCVIANIPAGVYWKDRASVYLGCNERVARDYGLTDPGRVVGRSDHDLAPDPAEAEARRAGDREVLDGGTPVLDREECHTRPDGTRGTYLTSKAPLRDDCGRVVGILGVYRDVTDRKRLEEQLRQAQKMEAVGRLAGGIAHDFNNLLTVIRGNAELLWATPGDAASGEMYLDLVTTADRAAALVRQLLMVSRRQPARVEVLDLNEVVASMSGLLGRLLGGRVVVEAALAARPVTVRADRSHLEQVVMNLAVNARDAMPGGGTLTIRTEATGHSATTEAAGRVARLTVADTGTGMTEEVRGRAFEPFFTTKGPDQGTGLGLATVFGIVQQAGGHV